jgi:Ca2+-binding RTX toxin-like protein
MWTVTLGATSGISNMLVNQSLAVLDDALTYWGRYIDFGSAILDINLSFKSLGATTLAQAGTDFIGIGGGILQAATILELQTGVDQNGATSDIDIDINSNSIIAGEFTFGGIDVINLERAKFDLFTVLLHEIGHGLGFVSLLNISETSVFDTFISGAPGSYEFTGPIAVGVAGGNVSLTEEPSHINASDLLGSALPPTVRRIISAIDIAILEDIGLPIFRPTELSDVIYGFSASDTVNLLGGDDFYFGVDGFDRISGGVGDDTLIGGVSNDTLDGDEGDDRLKGECGDDVLRGGDGNDTLLGDDGEDVLDGGAGIDIAGYAGSPEAVMADLQTGTASGGYAYGDTFISIEGLQGSAFADNLTGDAGANALSGDFGNDSLSGGSGSDTLRGGSGDDSISGGNDADKLFGDDGRDTLRGDGGDDLLFGGGGNDRIFGGGGNDSLFGNANADLLDGGKGADAFRGFGGNDRLFGGDGADSLLGHTGNDIINGGNQGDILDAGAGADQLFGDGGNDTLFGRDGNDTLKGGGGNDDIFGGKGADRITGGSGDDTLAGNGGNDFFIFAPGDDADVITGFVTGAGSQDVIDLSLMGALFDSFAEVFAAASDDGFGNTVIDFGGGDTITLTGVAVVDLHQDDFIFGL